MFSTHGFRGTTAHILAITTIFCFLLATVTFAGGTAAVSIFTVHLTSGDFYESPSYELRDTRFLVPYNMYFVGQYLTVRTLQGSLRFTYLITAHSE
jgi:hypothetical protein